ncbi:hypothetical protein SAMN05443999_1134 [Roseovarius azorensis]|uniref:Outer membrane protein n=1 Tax=Roseovarius azorensis TaxID=1287727 RepID=A0A1H7VQS1_9RHOB|nr:lipid A-modifier LpxR family protein [Roseovarius azorensis]SEM11167.1 hypothetical protein SAMN05443999_1134 [Roseovarius azorensis]
MKRPFFIAFWAGLALSAMLSSTMAEAGERQRLGYGRIFNNDLLGDGHDRWRTGNIASSRVWGPSWQGRLPQGFGQMLEFRFNGEIIAPENLSNPAPGDRPYVGALSFGLHTHFERGGIDYAMGADLVVTGSQTGLDDFHDFLHDVLGGRDFVPQVRDTQLSNAIRPSAVIEAGRDYDLGAVRLRPFAEARLGVEDLIRVGADITFGGVGEGELLVRDPVTGQRYRTIYEPHAGYSFVIGGDVAYVGDSDYLPSRSGVNVTEDRTRLRAGLHWEGRNGTAIYYGVTWLSEEFDAQREGQFVGSLRLRLRF